MAPVPPRFVELVSTITATLAARPLDDMLERTLARDFAPGASVFDELEAMCRAGCNEGWLCAREQGGIRFGRPVKPGAETHGYSVDVVEMDEVVGPHHTHPMGEIDMVMPIDDGARFDGTPRGWKVYPAGSAHRPTVTGGKALILYLLPDGAIEFTRA